MERAWDDESKPRLTSFLSRSSSCSLKEIPRTGPFWMRFMRCVVKPAILFLSLFEGMMAISSQILLLVWKSRVSLCHIITDSVSQMPCCFGNQADLGEPRTEGSTSR